MIKPSTNASPGGDRSRFKISFPKPDPELDQNKEWFVVEQDGRERRLRIHDYAEVYKEPGLYEALVYDALKCTSPGRIAELLAMVLPDWPESMGDLRVFDLGAGNGYVGEVLRKAGVHCIVGLDLLPEAMEAARRDRPGVYDDYLAADLCNLSTEQAERLRRHELNCLVTVAALGYGDIPPLAFGTAFNLIQTPGWLAMTIKEDFLDQRDQSGFARLMRRMIDEEILEIQAHHRYCHRVSIAGEKIFYCAIVARKTRDIPASYLADSETPAVEAVDNDHDSASMLLGR